MRETIKEFVARRKLEIKDEVSKLESKPKLAIVQVGMVEASQRYVKNKLKDCEEVGINAELVHFEDDTISEDELLNRIKELCIDKSITGVICQLPLPKHISETKVIDTINPAKDVDGFTKESNCVPATALGIIRYLESQQYNFVNKNVVIVGRGKLCSRPILKQFIDRQSNVSMINSKTSIENKRQLLRHADIIVSAAGCLNTLTDDDFKWTEYNANGELVECKNDHCFIFDVGITMNENGKLCGDSSSVTICERSEVPAKLFGSVGQLTRLGLLENVLKIYKK